MTSILGRERDGDRELCRVMVKGGFEHEKFCFSDCNDFCQITDTIANSRGRRLSSDRIYEPRDAKVMV